MNNRLLYLFCSILFVVLSSCEKDEDVGGTAVESVSGEWFVQVDGEGDYYHFSTYNTAENSSTTMFLDDYESFWQMKGKVNVNLSDLTFSANDVQNLYYDSKFTIINGKIIKGGAHVSSSNTVTDSIYFQVKFSDNDDPEEVFTLSGYKRTGFLEDEH